MAGVNNINMSMMDTRML